LCITEGSSWVGRYQGPRLEGLRPHFGIPCEEAIVHIVQWGLWIKRGKGEPGVACSDNGKGKGKPGRGGLTAKDSARGQKQGTAAYKEGMGSEPMKKGEVDERKRRNRTAAFFVHAGTARTE